MEIEGYRTGTYVRLEIHGVPCEMIEHFDPRDPILIGGIGLGEENVGYMQVRNLTVFKNSSCFLQCTNLKSYSGVICHNFPPFWLMICCV